MKELSKTLAWWLSIPFDPPGGPTDRVVKRLDAGRIRAKARAGSAGKRRGRSERAREDGVRLGGGGDVPRFGDAGAG